MLLRVARVGGALLSAAAALLTFVPWILSLPAVFRASAMNAIFGALIPLATLEVLRRARRAERERGDHPDAHLAFFFRHAAFLFGCAMAWLRVYVHESPQPLAQLGGHAGAWILPLTAFAFLWIWMRD